MKYAAFVALVGLTTTAALAQNLTSRSSKLNLSYVYGACGDTNSGSIPKEDFSLVAASSISQPFYGAASGLCPGDQPYLSSVSQTAFHGYQITGPLSGFSRIRGWGANSAYASSSGLGAASMISTAPGNQLILSFSVASAQNYNISGQTSFNDVGSFVALQRFDGFVWQFSPFYSLFLPGGKGKFNQSGVINPGTYRIVAEAATNAFGNEFSGAAYSFDLFIGAAPTIIQGQITLEDYIPNENGEEVTIEIYQNFNLVHTTTANLGVNGEYSAASPVAGTSQIRIKGRTWLTKRTGNVNLVANAVTPVNMSLLNGDCDGNNAITTDDYLILSGSFDLASGDAGFDARGDLDGSGSVTTDDYLILSTNFDIEGE